MFVRQRQCKFPSSSSLSTTQHQHIRRFIIPKDAVAIASKALETLNEQDNDDASQVVISNVRRPSTRSLQNGHPRRPKTSTTQTPLYT